MAKYNATGRSKGEPQYVRLTFWLLRTPAWRSLSAQARAVYVEIVHRYNGYNNSSIGFSVRHAAASCNIATNTAKRSFDELVEKGFIARVTPGGFSRKTRHATEWRLTERPCNITNAPPSKEFAGWRPVAENKYRSQNVSEQSQNTVIIAMKEALNSQVFSKNAPTLIPSEDFSVAK
jgi:hypothetical protein